MSTHTPGPWTTRKDGTIESKDGETVASFVDRPGDAAFIVRACNSHEAMLEVLKNAIRDGRLQTFEDRERFRTAAREAIRLAEGRG